jgi:pimeloyl-ACP methyl ester carboxylesterase
MLLKEKRKASLDSTASSLKPRSSSEMRTTKGIDGLFHFPEHLHPEYRQIPNFILLIVIIKAVITTYVAHFIVFRTKEEGNNATLSVIPVATKKYAKFGNTIFVANLFFDSHEKEESFEMSDADSIQHYFWMKCGLCIITTILLANLALVLLQEFYFFPSRVTPDTLIENKWFPSSLSRFSFVHSEIPVELNHDETFLEKDEAIKMNNIGVHYLEYKNEKEGGNQQDASSSKPPIDVIHFMHGFGANSLNWITTIKHVIHDLHAKVGIAHCGTGFGLSSRPVVRKNIKEDLAPYSSSGWAMIGNSLLIDRLNKDKLPDEDLEANAGNKRVVLIGHSMGCAATLKMALTLPAFEKVIILVAPALVGKPPNLNKGTSLDSSEYNQNVFMKILSSIKSKILQTLALFHDAIIEPVLTYLLARGVGTSGFWHIGLQFMGGYNPTEEHTLTLQWPAICHGW